MVKVKICGMTNLQDTVQAASCGVWAVGFIFYKKSPRFIGAFKARKIIDQLPPFVTPVGVFVNQKEGAVKDILQFCGINTVQFHGEETPEYCRRFKKQCKVIKAVRVNNTVDPDSLKKYSVDAFLLDAFQEGVFGGTGQTFPWHLAKAVKGLGVPLILSGGLNPQNVLSALESVNPYAVDVCSGVEKAPGHKNNHAVKEFVSITQFYQK